MVFQSDAVHVLISFMRLFFGIWTLHCRTYVSEYEDGPVVQ